MPPVLFSLTLTVYHSRALQQIHDVSSFMAQKQRGVTIGNKWLKIIRNHAKISGSELY